jgi:hypothetical protein
MGALIMSAEARIGKSRISNLPLIVKAKTSGPPRSSEWFDALYPVAIPFPASSKTQVTALGKQIPRSFARFSP